MVEVDNPTQNNYRMIKLVAIVFAGCVIVLFLTGFDMIKSRIRDAERRTGVKTLVKALELYHDKYNDYPNAADDWQGWDLSINYKDGEPDFLSELKKEGFINWTASDPVNDIFYHYRYQKFQAGESGCPNSFYILQIANFELSAKDNGKGECPEFNWAATAPNGYTVQNFN